MTGLEKRPTPDEYDEYYDRYIRLVPDGHIVATLEMQLEETLAFLHERAAPRADHAYGPGKWTVKQVVGHIADVERVFQYRALRFARADTTPLPGFDENAYVEAADFQDRPFHGLVDDLAAVRHSTVRLLRGLAAHAWDRRGTANDSPISVRALAWIVAGHELHHRGIIETRYLG